MFFPIGLNAVIKESLGYSSGAGIGAKKTNEWIEGPYIDRKKIMETLCKKAGVKYFRYHALRHCGASLLDGDNVPIGAIQRFLGHENSIGGDFVKSMNGSP